MNVKELVFKSRDEMSEKMESSACEYEGFVPGRNGYNFPNKDGSYTIAYIKGDILTKMHELRHAMYFFDSKYRKEVEDLWSSFSCEDRTVIEKFLAKCGYHKDMFLDEFQAYWFTEKNPRKFFGLKSLKR
jgi:hypothetical protein